MNATAPIAADIADVLDDPLEQARFSRQTVDAQGRACTESALQISGITCAACAGILEDALMRVPGVLGATVSAAAERATVRWDPQRTQVSKMLNAIRGAGYDAVPDAAAPARQMRRAEHRQALWRLFVAWFCMMQVMMLATPSYVAEPGDLAPDLARLLAWGMWVLSLPVVAFAAGPFFSGAWHALRQRRINMDVPVALGVFVAFVASTGATFDPGGPFGHEVYFDSLTMFVAFLLAARYLELRARHRATGHLEAALAAMPQTALRVRPDGADERVSVLRLKAGDLVRVPAGDAFAADGVLVEGRTRADEALLTGESTPVARGVGDAVVAGSLNVGAPVLMQVERAGADTRFAAIVSMMRDAATQRPAAARVADRIAGPFLWTVLLLAAGSAAVWSVVDPARAVWIAVAVLIVTCPCALSLAAPTVLVAAAGGLSRRGVLVQRLDAIETLAAADHLFVDKTGTLTEDRLTLSAVHVRSASDLDESHIRLKAAGLARWSTHPLSVALVAAAGAVTAGQDDLWTEVEEIAGQGLSGLDADGRQWRLGSAAWTGADALSDEGLAARVWLARDGVPLAAFEIDETLRPGAADALTQLRRQGLSVTLLSGDTQARALRLARQIDGGAVGAIIGTVIGGATPQAKLAAVEAAQQQGQRVIMVGDGVNDGPVLARADMSIAMGQGALVARVQADAVAVNGRWADIVDARRVAVRSMRLVWQNLAWAAIYNATCIPLAMLGYLPPWAAGLGMALSSLGVVANATRAAR